MPTKIEWTRGDDGSPGETWNPILGCDQVSPGCDNCYAIISAAIRAGNPNQKVATAFAGLVHRVDGKLDWTGVVNLLPERLAQPLRWKRGRRIFVNSLADLFHDAVPDEYIAKVFAVMLLAPQHTFQVLTKRHGRMRSLLRDPRFADLVEHAVGETLKLYPAKVYEAAVMTAVNRALTNRRPGSHLPPLLNVWIGVSVEDQKWANIRVPALIDTPAAVRWLSCEPLLGPVDLHRTDKDALVDGGIDWIVAGGESGPRARAMHPNWLRGLRDQCVDAGIPFMVKQWGEWGPAPWVVRVCDPGVGWQGTDEELAEAKAKSEAAGATHAYAVWAHEYDHQLYEPIHKPWSLERQSLDDDDTHAPMRRWGKKAAGRELDGKVWDEYPKELTGV